MCRGYKLVSSFVNWLFLIVQRKTADAVRIIDWSSDGCASDLVSTKLPSFAFSPSIVPGRSRAKGPISQPPPIVAPSIWLLARIFTPPATVTPEQKKTLGSIVTSRPRFVSPANQRVSGVIKLAPSAISPEARPACQIGRAPLWNHVPNAHIL